MNENYKYGEKQKHIESQRKIDARNIGISEYAGKPFLEMRDAERKLSELIDSDEPFLVGRIGETEMRTIVEYSSGRWLKKSCRVASYCICNNAGFFPRNPIYIRKFCKKYLESMYDVDYLALFAWNEEERYIESSNQLKGSFLAKVLDVVQCEYKWTGALREKKVLVISPFDESIRKQYACKEMVWNKDNNVMPDFELLTLKSVQSIGGSGAKGFKSWFAALAYMKKEIDKIDFDIALLGCGAYGLPLGAYIKNKGKKAIVVGGCLQLFFGIMGRRWEGNKGVEEYRNEYWVRPLENERPCSLEKIEGGCYW